MERFPLRGVIPERAPWLKRVTATSLVKRRGTSAANARVYSDHTTTGLRPQLTGKIGTQFNNLEELPVLSLEDLFTTECHPQVNLVTDVMDTLYDFEEGKVQLSTPKLEYQSPDLADLDGNNELSFDIKQLIDQSLQSQGNNIGGSSPGQLFPELLPQATGPNTTQVVNNNIVACDQDLLNSTANGILDLGSMPHLVLETDQSGQANIVFVKNEADAEEDLEEDSSFDLSVPPSPAPSSVGSERRGSYKAKAPSKRRQLEKGSNEYTLKRQRNNVAVRKSRDKAKQRQKETEDKVKTLTTQNTDLQKKVDLLSKELNVLKGLFANVGAALPKEYKQYIAKAVNR